MPPTTARIATSQTSAPNISPSERAPSSGCSGASLSCRGGRSSSSAMIPPWPHSIARREGGYRLFRQIIVRFDKFEARHFAHSLAQEEGVTRTVEHHDTVAGFRCLHEVGADIGVALVPG